MPHVFDHTPTAQEVFDEACRYFATSPGPSMGNTIRNGSPHPDCVYRNPNGRVCAAGHFLPDEAYIPEMDEPDRYTDGSDVKALVNHYGDRIPAWWAQHKSLLKSLQMTHDDEGNWLDGGWHLSNLAHDLRCVANNHSLKQDAIHQIAIRGWTEVEA